MRISELINEEINPDIRNPNFFDEQEINGFKYTARSKVGVLAGTELPTTDLFIRCYDGEKLAGKVDFEVRVKFGKKWLESYETAVLPEYQNKGIAATMYAYAKMLGNDVKPSPFQSDQGKKMWKKWGKDAKHLSNTVDNIPK